MRTVAYFSHLGTAFENFITTRLSLNIAGPTPSRAKRLYAKDESPPYRGRLNQFFLDGL